MPLLISKITETLPNPPAYSLPISTETGSPRVSELYDGSQDARGDASISDGSTPFHSPPLSAGVPQMPQFSAFQQEMGLGDSQGSSPFPHVIMTTGIEYGDMTVSAASMEVFPGTAIYHETGLGKFESD